MAGTERVEFLKPLKGSAETSGMPLPLPPPHPEDCPVCCGPRMVQVYPVRWSGDRMVASRVGGIRPCPFRSGTEDLRLFVAQAELTRPPSDGAA